ncbi:hypothetical protein B7463_g8509, partial [Scytalidium lignicola]
MVGNCDQLRPICLNCQKSQRHCTGALSPFMKSVDFTRQGGPKRKGDMANQKRDTTDLFSAMKIKDDARLEPQNHSDINTLNLISVSIPRQPTITQSSLLTLALTDRLAKASGSGFDLQNLGGYMPQISGRIGHNAALDAAVGCLLQGHAKLLRREPRRKTSGLDSYVQSLALLRRDLEKIGKDPNIQAPELVCVVIVLSIYELFKYETARAWIAHAGGISAIIKAWGPQQIMSDFDMALFTAQYGSIVMGTLFSGQDCFLATPEWDAVYKRCFRQQNPPDKISFDILEGLTTLSPLLRDTRTLLAAPSTDNSLVLLPSVVARAEKLRVRILRHSHQVESDFNDQGIVFYTVAAAGSPGFLQRELWFCNHKVAMRYGLYWASTIIAARILQRLHSLQDPNSPLVVAFEEEIQSCALKIMQSVVYLRTFAPFGALYMTFALHVVSAVTKPQSTRLWVRDALKELLAALEFDVEVNQMAFVGELLTGGCIQLPFIGKATNN